ncbi:mycofactocin-coupled SDR family oxidoreductase [Burkholderia sp. Ax-1719]|uniref:mycofactocin-coupled SDR family oxidoreductase n=1 Tax=Burkholderia sp. Ax-1719 TaxID=2608334 RepID=UPI0014242BC1|nr:mycofactocin-coupled SDR family oxidoreductase [Burkholderia sp. Ax-1719]NIE66894.1 mycofactocin-coupled SDR family oxidoreductase [Burkholderia sp. Ax-1719]
MGKLEGKVALITGAAQGQGRSHAVIMAQEGADIIAVDICEHIDSHISKMGSEEDLAETVRLVEETGRRVVSAKVDVRDESALRIVVDSAVEQLGRLDIVVCNAGIGHFSAALDTTEKEWDDTVDVNLKGVWQTARVGARHLIAGNRGGSIIMTGSAAGLHGGRNAIAYVAAKHGLVGLMRGLAMEWGQFKIRVNAVHPTQCDTDMCMNNFVYGLFCPDKPNATKEDFAPVSQTMHTLPVPWVDPKDISRAMVFLASDDARFITGVNLPVDAGNDLLN